jgi:hypothetical protein
MGSLRFSPFLMRNACIRMMGVSYWVPMRILVIDGEEGAANTFLPHLLADPLLHVNVGRTHEEAENLLRGAREKDAGPWFDVGLVNVSSHFQLPNVESYRGPVAFALELRERVKRKWIIGPRASPPVYTYSHLYRGPERVQQLRGLMEGVFTDVIDVAHVRDAVRLELEAFLQPAFADTLQRLHELQKAKREQVEQLLAALGEEFRTIYLELFPHRRMQWGLA